MKKAKAACIGYPVLKVCQPVCPTFTIKYYIEQSCIKIVAFVLRALKYYVYIHIMYLHYISICNGSIVSQLPLIYAAEAKSLKTFLFHQ